MVRSLSLEMIVLAGSWFEKVVRERVEGAKEVWVIVDTLSRLVSRGFIIIVWWERNSERKMRTVFNRQESKFYSDCAGAHFLLKSVFKLV